MHLEPPNKELFVALRDGDLAGVTRSVEARPEFLQAPTGDPRHGDLLAFAAQVGDLRVVRYVFDRMAHPDVQVGLARACRSPVREFQPVIEFFLARGANPRGLYSREYRPVIFVPCENLQPDVLRLMITLGADPQMSHRTPDGRVMTPFDMLVSTDLRAPIELHRCIDVLAESGVPILDSPLMAVYRGDEAALERHLSADPSLLTRTYDVPSANTPLFGATLLHIAAEFCEVGIARLLLTFGAKINARAGEDEEGFGGHTAIFHTVNSIWNRGFAVFKLLIERGADVGVRANVRHLGFGLELRDLTPLRYALEVPRDGAPHPEVVDVLRLIDPDP